MVEWSFFPKYPSKILPINWLLYWKQWHWFLIAFLIQNHGQIYWCQKHCITYWATLFHQRSNFVICWTQEENFQPFRLCHIWLSCQGVESWILCSYCFGNQSNKKNSNCISSLINKPPIINWTLAYHQTGKLNSNCSITSLTIILMKIAILMINIGNEGRCPMSIRNRTSLLVISNSDS